MSKSKDTYVKFFAGLFFIIGVAIVIMFIGRIGQDKGFSEPKFTVSVLFGNVGGLIEGAPVRISGVNVGTVASIDFLDKEFMGKRVKVDLNIIQKFVPQLKKANSFTIQTEGILGEKLVGIDYVENLAQLDMNKPILGQDPLDVLDLAKGFSRVADAFANTANEMGAIDMQELSSVMIESSKALLSTSEGLNKMMSDFEIITKKSKRILDRLEQKVIDGNLFKVF